MKVCKRSRGMAPLILNLGAIWRCVVSFTFLLLHLLERTGYSMKRSRCYENEESLLSFGCDSSPHSHFFFCLLRSQLWFILMSTYIPCRVLKYSDFVICVSHLHQSLATICCDIDKESVHLAGDEAVLLLVKSCGWHFHIITETKGMVCVSWARGWRVTKLSTLQSW